MRRWTFFFDEGNIKSEVSTDEEHTRISALVKEDPRGMLFLPGDNLDIYVNLSMVKCIASQPLTQEQLDAEKAAKEQPTKAPANE